MHLTRTSGNHALQQSKLLIHLASSPPLDQAMRRLASNLSSSSTSRTGLLLLSSLLLIRRVAALTTRTLSRRSFSSTLCILSRSFSNIFLAPRLHLDDFARSRRRRRQRKRVFLVIISSGRRSSSGLDGLGGLHWVRAGQRRRIRRRRRLRAARRGAGAVQVHGRNSRGIMDGGRW